MDIKSEKFIEGLRRYANIKIGLHQFFHREKKGILRIKFTQPRLDQYDIEVKNISLLGINKVYEKILNNK